MAFLLRGPIVRELEARMRQLPQRRRVAVAAVCAEQVLPIFETMKDYGGDELRDAIALAKRYADGEAVMRDEIQQALRRVRESIPPFDAEYDPETPTRMAWSVNDAVQSVLRAADERSPSSIESAAGAIRNAYEAVARFVDYDDLDEGDAAEEEAWQEGVLRSAEATLQGPLNVARHDPHWLVRLKDEWGWEPSPA